MVIKNSILKKPKTFTIKNNVIVGDESKSTETRGIAQILWESLSEIPDFVSQINVNTGEKTTFAEIKERSIRCALWLREQGVSKDDVIAISTPNQNDDLIPYIATLFVGAIVNPWYHDITEVNARRFFQTYRPKIIFACEYSIDRLAHIANSEGIACSFVVYGKHPKYSSLRGLLAEQSQEEVASFKYTIPDESSKQCAIILFSSGTTGTPKGTMLSYQSFINFGLKGFDKRIYLWYSSLSWITGASLVIACIRTQSTRIIHGEFDTEETSKVIEKYKVNRTLWTPSMMIQCCKAKVYERYDLSSLENIVTKGSKVSKSILEEIQRALPHCFVKNSYGMTELGGLAVTQTNDRKKIDSVGYVIPDVKLKIIDIDTGFTLGSNQPGEIWIQKPNTFLGYYNNPLETNKTRDEDGWVHTGDLGYYDEDGEIMVIDRIKQLIITKNYHVSPTEIEGILLQHPEVKDCAVVPVAHEVDIERPFAFVVRLPQAKVTEEELMELPTCRDECYRLSGGVVFVDDLIYTSSGKKHLQLLKGEAKKYIS